MIKDLTKSNPDKKTFAKVKR